MKKYKVFYKDSEVAEFNILYNAVVYIHNQLGIDKELKRKDFYVYEITDIVGKSEIIFNEEEI